MQKINRASSFSSCYLAKEPHLEIIVTHQTLINSGPILSSGVLPCTR